MQKYVPVNLAFEVIEPISGTDESLTPIIFLHGCFESKELWHDIPQVIADKTKRKAYLYDARDHGDSPWTDQFTFHHSIDDLNYFMDSKNIQKAILIGHSMGGWTASRLALRMPGKVELLIVEEFAIDVDSYAMACVGVKFAMQWQKAVQAIPKELNEMEGVKFALDYLYRTLPPQIQKSITPKKTLYKIKFPLKRNPDGSYDVKHNIKALGNANLLCSGCIDEPNGIYTGPAYFIHGALSPVKVNNQDKIRKHFPCGEMIIFEGATHRLHLEFPEKFINTILKTLQ